MKLYTLDYNCNQPLTQQVNIATNTDAKLGIKVQKDGEYLNLDGSSLSVVTPNATISADEELTNGYVTFPISIGDEPTLTQDTVVLDKQHCFNGTVKHTGQWPATPDPTVLNPAVLQVNAKDLDAVGAVVNANDIGPKQIKYWSNVNPPPEALSDWNDAAWLPRRGSGRYIPAVVIVEGGIDEHGNARGQEVYCKTKADDTTKFVFADLVPGTATFINERETYTLTEKSTFVRNLNFNANWYYGQAIDLVLDGTPTKATFKLNVNGFKSQQGDKDFIGELPYIPSETINIAGTYTDNTPFSYDVFINEQ